MSIKESRERPPINQHRCRLFVASAAALIAASLSAPRQSLADASVRALSRSSSTLKFGVDSPSPSLRMSGTFSNYSGLLRVNPRDLSPEAVEVSLDLRSVQLPPDQILQAVFVQTAIAQMKAERTTFRSTSISKISGNDYLVSGVYGWKGKDRATSVVARMIRAATGGSEFQIAVDGKADAKNAGQLEPGVPAIQPGTRGWAKAKLVFIPK